MESKYPFQSAHDFHQAESFSQQTKMCRNQHLRCGLHNFKIKSFLSADTLCKHLSRMNFKSSCTSLIEDYFPIFGTLYYTDIFKYLHFLLTHLPFQVHLDLEAERLAYLECHRLYSKMNTVDWDCDTQHQLSARARIVPVICTSNKTHLTKVSGDQHALPLYLTIGNIGNNIRHTHNK